jgi:hypothetical protein
MGILENLIYNLARLSYWFTYGKIIISPLILAYAQKR